MCCDGVNHGYTNSHFVKLGKLGLKAHPIISKRFSVCSTDVLKLVVLREDLYGNGEGLTLVYCIYEDAVDVFRTNNLTTDLLEGVLGSAEDVVEENDTTIRFVDFDVVTIGKVVVEYLPVGHGLRKFSLVTHVVGSKDGIGV